MRTVLFWATLVHMVWHFSTVLSDNDSDALNDGIKAATGLLKTLGGAGGAETFAKFASMATKIGPFLGALGPAVGIISAFMPTESPELSLLKKEFAKIDAKFDRVFSQFDEVKTAVQKSTMKVQYSKYERRIITLSGYLQDISQEKDENVFKFLKNMFLESYAHYYGDSADYLRLGMLNTGPFAVNIPEILVKSKDNDRGKIYRAMKSALSLILQGIKVEYAYYALSNQTENTKFLKRDWNEKINRLLTHIDTVDQKVKDNFLEGARKDSEKMLADYQEKDCKQLADDLYKFLSEKYSWRDWLVAAYDAKKIKGDKKHWVVTCGGFLIEDKHGKHLAVASVDQSVQKLNKDKAFALLRKTKGSTKARVLIEKFYPGQYKNYCAYGYIDSFRKRPEQLHIAAKQDRFVLDPSGGWWRAFIFNKR